MNILISTDLEGISGNSGKKFPSSSTNEYKKACEQLTKEINLIVDQCFKHNAKKVFIADGHGSGRNILRKKIDPRAKLFQGKTKKLTMMEGAEKSDFCIFLGYHGRANVSNSFWGHTNSKRNILSVSLNGIEVGEGEINATIGKFFKCKLIFEIGTDKAIKEMSHLVKVPSVITKNSISYYKAELKAWTKVRKEIIEKLDLAFKEIKKINYIPIETESVEWIIEVPYAHLLENLSIKGIKKISDRKIKIEKINIFKGFLKYKDLQDHLSKKYKENLN